MRTVSRQVSLSSAFTAGCLAILFGACSSPTLGAISSTGNVLCRPEFAASRQRELVDRLRDITGWRKLHFDENGSLRSGDAHAGGSPTARALLQTAISGKNMYLLEDASNSADVVFGSVVQGHWTKGVATKPPPVYILLLDFADFARVTGDRDALAAFNVGWGVLHEIAHIVYDSPDSEREGEAGECERLINRMRRECDLAERKEYFFTFFPGLDSGDFKTRFVRLAFERQQPATNKKKRLWLM